MSIAGVGEKNETIYQDTRASALVSFYALRCRILFLERRKLRTPQQMCFKTLVLLLQPSVKPFVHARKPFYRKNSPGGYILGSDHIGGIFAYYF